MAAAMTIVIQLGPFRSQLLCWLDQISDECFVTLFCSISHML